MKKMKVPEAVVSMEAMLRREEVSAESQEAERTSSTTEVTAENYY